MKKASILVIFIIQLLIFMFGYMCVWTANREYKEYKCMTEHYPDQFVEIEMISDVNYDTTLMQYFDKGKAIYDYHYIYDGVIYRTEITDKEFDDTFYICPHNPSNEYSIHDLENATGTLIGAIVMGIFGVIFMLPAALMGLFTIWATWICIKESIEHRN